MTPSARRDSIAGKLAALPAFPELPGRRVRLRGPRADDADALLALFAEPEVMRYWSRPPMTTAAEAAGLVAEVGERFARREMINWMVATRGDDAVIGTCSLSRFDTREGIAEVGYALRFDRWGQGLAGEAVALALAWGFRHLGLRRIDASIDPRNARSRQVLQRLGFAVDVRHVHDAGVVPAERYALLVDDGRRRQA